MKTKERCSKDEIFKLRNKDTVDVLVFDEDNNEIYQGTAQWSKGRMMTIRKIPASGLKAALGLNSQTVTVHTFGINYTGGKFPDLEGAFENANNPNDPHPLPMPLVIKPCGTLLFENGLSAYVSIPGGRMTKQKAKKLSGTARIHHWGDPNPLTSTDKEKMGKFSAAGWDVDYQGMDDHCPYFEITKEFKNVDEAISEAISLTAKGFKIDSFYFEELDGIKARHYLEVESDDAGGYDMRLREK